MNYSEMFKKSFSSVSPVKNDEELLKSVLERTGKMNNKKKIRLKKPLIAVLAAIIAIAAATITVGAATNWGYIDYFKNMFAKNYQGSVAVNTEVIEIPAQTKEDIGVSTAIGNETSTTQTPVSETTVKTTEKVEYVPEQPIGTFDFEKHGKKLGITMQGDGVTATVDGILAYDDMCYMIYTVEATDELLEKTNGEIPGLRIDFGNFGFKVDGEIAGGMGYSTGSLFEDGNKRTGFIEIQYDNTDIAGKTLNVTFVSDGNFGGIYTEILRQTQDILVDFPASETIEKELGTAIKTDSFDGKLTKARISGFRTMLFFDGVTNVPTTDFSTLTPEQFEDEEFMETIYSEPSPGLIFSGELIPAEEAAVTLKNGTTVVAKAGSTRTSQTENRATIEIELRYTYPVYPNDIESISFGNYKITIN